MTPSFSAPTSWLRPACAISRIRAASSSTRAACSTIWPPNGVTVTSVLPRSNSRAPSSSSSFWIATDSAGWLTKHFCAARPKFRSWATATR